MERQRLFGDFSLVALASLALIALGLSSEFGYPARAYFYVAAALGVTPLARASLLRLWGAVRESRQSSGLTLRVGATVAKRAGMRLPGTAVHSSRV